MHRCYWFGLWLGTVLTIWGGVPGAGLTQAIQVAATVETEPVPNRGDAADDPCIWIHPTAPSRSTIIGTDKQGGLAVYDLAGHTLQYLPDGRLNNVDIRYRLPLGSKFVDLVTAGNRSNDSIAIYKVNPATGKLEDASARTISTGIEVYGSCMYRSRTTGKYYFYVNSKKGEVQQWELSDNGSGKVDARKVRDFDVGSQLEGCVADDELGCFYVGEEDVGIWKYGAEPDDGTERALVDSTDSSGHLTKDVEGLTIYYASDSTGYLIASSQGSDEFVIYRREGNNAYIVTFQIAASNGIDKVTGTDGIDVVNSYLGVAFPKGVFVAQDDENDDGNQNYKLVPWQAIAEAVSPPLKVDTSWDPRKLEHE